MSPRVLIVGGGLAGLSATVALAQRGYQCTLVESRPRLGGRASSFRDSTTDSEVDNCQHVTLGCCTNFRHFCETTGLAEYFQRENQLNFIGPSGAVDKFSAGSFPAPLHLAASFARLSYLSLSDKIGLARGLKALARDQSEEDEHIPFSKWLKQQGQSESTIQRFWLVVLVSALSESLDRISVQHARKVFVDAFLAHRDGWVVDVPTVPLEQLYGGRLLDWLTSHGVELRLGTSADRLQVGNQSVTGVRTASGESLQADEYVVAMPFYRVQSVLPPSLSAHPDLAGIGQLDAAPITSIHLWFDRPITSLRHAVLVDRLCQWVFNRTAISGSTISTVESEVDEQGEPARSYYYQVVISASQSLAGLTKDIILADVLAELTAVWPETARANLIHSRQVTEHRAVFSPVPGVDKLRPYQQSPIGNLQFAGDWTKTGWPATMEGAVRSGYLAAENILRNRGQAADVLQPDLPVSSISKWLFGL